MPNIRQYESNARPLEPDNMASQAYAQEGYHAERMADIVGRNVDEGIKGLQRGIGQLKENVDLNNTVNAYSQASSMQVDAMKNLQGTANSSDTSKGDPFENWQTETWQPGVEKIADTITDPRAKAEFQMRMDERGSSLLDHGYSIYNQRVVQNTQNNLDSLMTSSGNQAIIDPGSAPDILSHGSAALDAIQKANPNAVSVEAVAAGKRELANQVYGSAMTSMTQAAMTNPKTTPDQVAQLKSIFTSDEYKNSVKPEVYDHNMDALAKIGETQQDTAGLVVKKLFPQFLDQTKQSGDPTGDGPKWIAQMPARTPEQQADKVEAQSNYDKAIAVYGANKTIGDMPQPQVAAAIKQAQDQSAGNHDLMQAGPLTARVSAMQQAARERDEAFAKDPAQYVQQHNEPINALWQNYQTLAQKNDPGAGTALQHFVAANVAEQTRLYPNAQPHVLTKDTADQIGQSLRMTDSTPQAALQNAVALGTFRQNMGPFATQAVHELMAEKKITPAQYVAGTLIGNKDSQMLAQEVLIASAVPKAEMDTTSPMPDAKAMTMARNAFAPLASTLKGTANGQDLLDGYITATANVLRNRAMTAGQSYVSTSSVTGQDATDASNLASQMVLGHYNIAAGLRIPLGMDKDDVVGGTKNVLGDIGNHDLVMAPSYGGLINSKEEFANDVKSDGYWVTNGQGDGAVLYYQGAPVQEKRGNVQTPVTLKFSQFETLGKQSRSTLDKAERFVANPGSL